MNQDVLIWCLVAVAAVAVAAVAVLVVRNRALGNRKRQAEAEFTRQRDEAERRLEFAEAELRRFQREQAAVISEAEHEAEERTKAVLKGAARLLQSLTAEEATVLGQIQRTYGGHPVLTDLLDVHHANAQMARKSEGIAVMCGAPLGRRSRPASVYDVVRNAQSQIRNFQRVEIMQFNGIALKASAVAPVALTVAELLDNAASFSQQDAPIEVTFQRVQNNVCIVIDDAGVGMNDEDRQAATELLSGDLAPRLSQLGTQPKFGFPVVGLLARQYGFAVDVTGVSRYGGVRAVVRLPEELWTTEEAPQPVQEAPVSSIRSAEGRPRARARTVHGLPVRGARKSPIASVADDGDGAGVSRPPTLTGRSLGGLQRGTLSGRTADAPSTEGSEEA
ncbi:ATP-binding protein [Streptomyces pluripotens]|uniref:histidine kinase n=1 Tax=Streptomyces pluripotens TaxID=1355015 RepID=A0A221NZN6_9ACTN|nr:MULTISPECIES: ATP-binding protein [Streptomyces]ARP71034.1 ATP-binding protein [Streptomyces pluripotens]ASN25286.1 ATP-binding protein [Streptomyces pluripotens]KIE25923.1 ATP-binding protein [Streptomyces sp. MUSC 125]MCH0557201.1 sensor histidine kinase [Streptomyces sp. MUM 16J]